MNIWTTKLRAPAVAVALTAACIAVPSVQAAEKAAQKKASRQETVGVTSGFAIGAAAGGPIGAIVGAAAGAWLGDRYHRQDVAKTSLARNLDWSEAERARLSGTLVSVKAEGERLGKAIERTNHLETTVSFRTDDATVTPEGAARLKKLGALAGALPDAVVRVSAFADPRGSEEYNAKLSERRAEAVAAVLAESGLDASRLIIEAHGESQSTTPEGDLDGYAFDRRVTVRIEKGSPETLARLQ